MRCLYTYGEEEITDSDFTAALRSLGVVEGDTLFIHSDIRSFGKLAASNRDEFLGALVNIFEESVGITGTIIMPTFTYSFGANKDNVFDREKTKSTVGSLTEYFRLQPGVERTTQPMMSVAIRGADMKKLAAVGPDVMGPQTIFDNLYRANGKIVLFGVDLNSCTFLHHIEQMHLVPYRFMKKFAGTIVVDGLPSDATFQYFVRPLDVPDERDFNLVEPHLRKEGVLREVNVGTGTITLIAAQDLYRITMELLDRDQYALLKKNPKKS